MTLGDLGRLDARSQFFKGGSLYRTLVSFDLKQESVRPRWPYDMRPSARAEKYMCVIVIR